MHVTLPTGSAANASNTPVTSVLLLGKTETQRQRMDPKESVWSAEYCLQSATRSLQTIKIMLCGRPLWFKLMKTIYSEARLIL